MSRPLRLMSPDRLQVAITILISVGNFAVVTDVPVVANFALGVCACVSLLDVILTLSRCSRSRPKPHTGSGKDFQSGTGDRS